MTDLVSGIFGLVTAIGRLIFHFFKFLILGTINLIQNNLIVQIILVVFISLLVWRCYKTIYSNAELKLNLR